MCPNMRASEWKYLYDNHRDLFDQALEIEENAAKNGNFGRGGGGLFKGTLRTLQQSFEQPTLYELFDEMAKENDSLEDRCHHGGCFT